MAPLVSSHICGVQLYIAFVFCCGNTNFSFDLSAAVGERLFSFSFLTWRRWMWALRRCRRVDWLRVSLKAAGCTAMVRRRPERFNDRQRKWNERKRNPRYFQRLLLFKLRLLILPLFATRSGDAAEAPFVGQRIQSCVYMVAQKYKPLPN